MGAIQSAVNKAIAGAGAAVVASPQVQTKIKERSLESEAQKAATISEQSKVDISSDSLAKRYPIGKSKAEREQQKIQASDEVGKLQQSVAAQNDLTSKLEAIYKNNPTEENFKRYMDQKAAANSANVPAQNEIQNIQKRLNFIEPDSIEKRKIARERLQRRMGAKQEQQKDLMNLLSGNNIRVDQLTPEQKSMVVDAINDGGRR